MSLLMPDLERQLREVVRAHIGVSAPAPRRVWPRAVLALAVTGVVAAVVAVALVTGARTSGPGPAHPGARAAAASGCAPDVHGPAGDYGFLSGGTVDGHSWVLERRLGAPGITRGRVLIDGRPFGFCRGPLDFTVVNLLPHGLVYGFLGLAAVKYVDVLPNAVTTKRPRVIAAQVAVPTATGTFFLAVLPGSACGARDIALAAGYAVATDRTGLRGAELVRQLGRCRGLGEVVPTVAPPAPPSFPGAPSGLPAADRPEFFKGRAVAEAAGCAACHQLGATGNNGPGPPLTDIGAKLSPAALRAALLHPRAPMPSFAAMKPAQLQALIAYLSELRGQR